MPWECPRCGRINAYWVMTCQCPPRMIEATTTNLEMVEMVWKSQPITDGHILSGPYSE